MVEAEGVGREPSPQTKQLIDSANVKSVMIRTIFRFNVQITYKAPDTHIYRTLPPISHFIARTL